MSSVRYPYVCVNCSGDVVMQSNVIRCSPMVLNEGVSPSPHPHPSFLACREGGRGGREGAQSAERSASAERCQVVCCVWSVKANRHKEQRFYLENFALCSSRAINAIKPCLVRALQVGLSCCYIQSVKVDRQEKTKDLINPLCSFRAINAIKLSLACFSFGAAAAAATAAAGAIIVVVHGCQC
jgi:hypothetical protein